MLPTTVEYHQAAFGGNARDLRKLYDGHGRDAYTRPVNILAPPKARLTIEVVHDLVCPWCFLGMRRLTRTLRRRPDLLFDVSYRPFLLNPDMPRLGMSRADYVMRKFGAEDRARRLYASISEIGRLEGVQFRFDRIRRIPSSINAHRLARYAARFGVAGQMVEALFSGYFTDGQDIGDTRVLLQMAEGCGLDTAAARLFLESDGETDAIHADNLRAHRLGINGVPCFVVAGRHAIAGAQEPEVIERLLDVAAVEATIG
jgi:predicted DsbA family dithiol-disulfide isomerase